MLHQKEQQRHRLGMAGRAFKMLSAMLGRVGISFSGRYNALYDIGDFVRVIISMCESSSCASGVTKMLSARHGPYRIPLSMWTISKVRNACTDADVMEKRCRDMMRITIHEARRTGLLRNIPHTMAIDTHLIPRYDKNPRTLEEQLVRSRHRSGTSRFEDTGMLKGRGPKPPARMPLSECFCFSWHL